LAQINQENALAEQIRQYNASLAEEKRQYNETMAYNRNRSSGSPSDDIVYGQLSDNLNGNNPSELTQKDVKDIENAITVLDRIPVDVVVGSGENKMEVNEYVVNVIEKMGLSESATTWLLNNYKR
jgi:hypothetical protein